MPEEREDSRLGHPALVSAAHDIGQTHDVPRGRKPDHVRCTVADCGRRHYAKGFCSRHYRQKRRLEGPRCTVPGCDRKVYARGRCEGHDKAPTRTIRPVRANARGRTLAWGRLYVQRASVPVVAEEARRRQLSPGGLMSEVIDQWAKALKSGAWPRNSLAPCAFPGCPRPLYVRGLERRTATHQRPSRLSRRALS